MTYEQSEMALKVLSAFSVLLSCLSVYVSFFRRSPNE